LPEYEARLGMLKRGMKDNVSSLEDNDFKELAKKTEGFSGSDIAILIRDSVFEPVRRLQIADRFKKVDGKYVPCKPG
jgi:vacuolar protein-sorting-associated protein 4